MVNLAAFSVVPDGWAERHRPIVAGFLPERVIITRDMGEVEVIDNLRTKRRIRTQITPEPIRALVQVIQTTLTPDRRDAGEKKITVTDYIGRFDVAWLPESGDHVIVTASPDPANLGTYVVHRRESQGHVVDRTVHLERVATDATH